MDKKVRISESNLRNMIGECIVEVLNEGIFDTVKQKLGDYYRGFSQKDPSEVSTPDEFFANCGWDVKGSQESTKRPGATNYLLVRKTGTFGAFNGTEVQDLVSDFNEKFGGQYRLSYLGKSQRNAALEMFRVYPDSQPAQGVEPAGM